jgi:hypothetical protein
LTKIRDKRTTTLTKIIEGRGAIHAIGPTRSLPNACEQ